MKRSNCAVLSLVGLLAVCLPSCSGVESEHVPVHQTFVVESKELKEARTINVYLPPDYKDLGVEVYPVVYMPDGGVKEDFPHIATTIDTAIRTGEMRPVLLIGIENTQRRRDMTGPTEVDTDREIAPVVGGSAAFRAFIGNELIPEIGKRYRVSDDAGIIGESAAGLFIVETFFLQPELFDKYIALSPSLWWNNEELVRRASERLQSNPNSKIDLHLAAANEDDIAPQVGRLADILRKDAPSELRWTYDPRPDLRHHNIYRALSPQVLRKFYSVDR